MANALQTVSPNQEQIHQPEDENREFTCEICIEPAPISEKKFENGNKCSHSFCTDCVIKYIRFQLDDYNVGDIRCPALDCGQTLDPVSCAAVVGPAVFVRWCDVLCESAISGMDKWYCPERNCGVMSVNECGRREKAQCPNCKELFCFNCRGVWRKWHACEQRMDWNDVVLANLAKQKKWKRCPRCSLILELVEGCSSVRCRCGIIFCYDCGKKISSGHCRCMGSVVRISRQVPVGVFILCSATLFTCLLFLFSCLLISMFVH